MQLNKPGFTMMLMSTLLTNSEAGFLRKMLRGQGKSALGRRRVGMDGGLELRDCDQGSHAGPMLGRAARLV